MLKVIRKMKQKKKVCLGKRGSRNNVRVSLNLKK